MGRALAVVVTSLVAVAFAGGVLGQGGAPKGMAKGSPKGGPEGLPSPEQLIERLDADGDGRVSRDEFRGPPNRFTNIDGDQDGFLTVEEFAAARQGPAQRSGATPMPKAAAKGATPARACTFKETASPDPRWTIKSYSPDCAFAGTTLFTAEAKSDAPRLVEIDMTGRVVWEYRIDHGVGRHLSYKEMEFHQPMDAERLPNGNTLFSLKHLGVYEIDKAGKLVWKHEDDGVSHDVDRLANGNTIYVRGWAPKGRDHIREVTPDGKLVWRWNGLAQYDREPFADMDREGWMHVNAVTRLPNGNPLVTAFDHLIELDANSRVVWQLSLTREKSNRQNWDKLTGILFKAQRIAPDGTAYGG